MARLINAHLQGDKVAKLINLLVGGTPTVSQEIGYDTTSKRLTQFDGTKVQQIAHMEDVIDAREFQGILTTAVYPTVSNLFAGTTNTTIQRGDTWIYQLASSTNLPSAPAFGNIKVSNGDKIIALIDGASTNANFAVIQTNIDDSQAIKGGSFAVTTVANTALTVAIPGFSATSLITGYVLRSSTGEEIIADVKKVATGVSITSTTAITAGTIEVTYKL